MEHRNMVDRNKIHELHGIVGGLDFLGKRRARSKGEDGATMAAFADAVARYATIVATYRELLGPQGDLAMRQEAIVKGLDEITAMLRSAHAGGGVDKKRVSELSAQAMDHLKILVTFFS